jgi:Fe-S-cluster containining protein
LDLEKGKCCSGPSGNVWLTKTDAEQISSKLEIEPKAFLKKFARWVPRIERWTLIEKTRGDHFDCIFLENGKTCAIYDVRPTQCKTYPYWPAVMESKETWESEKQDCEGIGREDANVATAEQIMQTLEKQKRDTEKTYEMGKKPTF